MDYLTSDTSLTLMRAAEAQAKQVVSMAKKAGEIGNIKEIEAAAQDFEAVFLSQMIKPMFEGLKPNSTFGGGKGEEVFSAMMVQEYGKIMAENGGIGIAKHVKAEMIRIQEELEK